MLGVLGSVVRWALVAVLAMALLAPVALFGALAQRNASLRPDRVVTPEQAAEARAFVNRVRATLRESEGAQTVTATETELVGLIATGERLVRGLRGVADIDPERGLVMAMSVPGPAGFWANFGFAMGPSERGVALQRLKIGRLDLGGDAALGWLVWALDGVTSDDLGTLLLASVERVEMAPGRVTAVIDGGGLGEESLFSQTVAGMRDALGLGGGERAKAHFDAMSEAAARGELPSSGSAAPWLRFAVQRVAEAGHESGRAARQDLRAALLALGAHCGDLSAVETVAGAIAPENAPRSPCAGVTLGGRDDLRKHFTLSAAFAAAGTSSVSWGLGEVKELVDAGSGGSGFSFDDVAMDRAGIAFAERLRRARLGEAAALAARIEGEESLAPSIEGLPSFLSADAFRSRFGSVEDPRYIAQLEEIDGRILALPFHAP